MDTDIISDNHLKTIEFLVSIFNKYNIEYQFTGGLAGNVYGSTWTLHDIDIDVAQKDIQKVASILKDYTIRPLSRFVDEEFDLLLLALRINDVEVEINQAEDAFIFANGIKTKLNIDLSRRNKRCFLGLEIYVQSLNFLIDYKKLLGRQADVSELIKLSEVLGLS
jgi:phosphorylcholine metabolism protein LicD